MNLFDEVQISNSRWESELNFRYGVIVGQCSDFFDVLLYDIFYGSYVYTLKRDELKSTGISRPDISALLKPASPNLIEIFSENESKPTFVQKETLSDFPKFFVGMSVRTKDTGEYFRIAAVRYHLEKAIYEYFQPKFLGYTWQSENNLEIHDQFADSEASFSKVKRGNYEKD